MSFEKGVLYALPTTGEFNMCNCTLRTTAPRRRQAGTSGPSEPSRAGSAGHLRTVPHRPEQARTSDARTGPHARFPTARGKARGAPVRHRCTRRTLPDSRAPGALRHKKSRWTRRSPARSRRRNPHCTGMAPVGAGVRRMELWAGCTGWGTCKPSCGAARQGCVRPRCAAAEYPQAVRGPLPRGTGGVHRACGWT